MQQARRIFLFTLFTIPWLLLFFTYDTNQGNCEALFPQLPSSVTTPSLPPFHPEMRNPNNSLSGLSKRELKGGFSQAKLRSWSSRKKLPSRVAESEEVRPTEAAEQIAQESANYETEVPAQSQEAASDSSEVVATRLNHSRVPRKILDPNEHPLTPWGYQPERNVKRWTVIASSIEKDLPLRKTPNFTVVDYGSDQGYFSIATAHHFPSSQVLSIELGGLGGIIMQKSDYDKLKDSDVLQVQEEYIQDLGLANVGICQATAHQDQFVQLNAIYAKSDYQYVLSVLHWFNMPVRKEFEYVLVQLLRNARTTFLELPVISSAYVIRQQVGYERFKKWYDDRTSIEEVLHDAATAYRLKISVTTLLKPKHRLRRSVYRVDVLHDVTRRHVEDNTFEFRCQDRRRIYGCKKRALYQSCKWEQ